MAPEPLMRSGSRREADSTGLHFYRARFYDSKLQRFASEDPLGFDGGDFNVHSYVRNDPLILKDPLGTQLVIPIPVPIPFPPVVVPILGGIAGYHLGHWIRDNFFTDFPDSLNPPRHWEPRGPERGTIRPPPSGGTGILTQPVRVIIGTSAGPGRPEVARVPRTSGRGEAVADPSRQ